MCPASVSAMTPVARSASLSAGTASGRPHELAEALVARHADALYRVARRYSLCADDAWDACQRASELLLRRAPALRRQTVAGWLYTVVKHEAMAIRAERRALLAGDPADAERGRAGQAPSLEERIAIVDLRERSAEALARLKPQQRLALALRAHGYSYAEIAKLTRWSPTKVNRLVTEGRRAFAQRRAEIAAGAECERWRGPLAAARRGEASVREVEELRPHLARCSACRAMLTGRRDESNAAGSVG